LKKLFNVQLKVIRNYFKIIFLFGFLLAAPKITKKPTDTEALLHTDAVFTVDVSGSPKPQIEW